MLAMMTFVASLVLLGTPGALTSRKALLPGAVLGAYDASVALWIARRAGEPSANFFSHLMIGTMIAVVAAAGFVMAAELKAARALPVRQGGERAQLLALGCGAAVGLTFGCFHWYQLLRAVPELPAVMEARAGGAIGVACLSLRSLLVEDVMYRVFLLSGLVSASGFVLPYSRKAATALALVAGVLILRLEPAHTSLSAGLAAAVYGAVYLRWGFWSLLAARLTMVLLAWPLARYLVLALGG
jgi:hypothetical protein